MQVTHLIDNSRYLLSVFWCPSLLIKVCKQAQSTQDLSSQSTQRCDCSFSSTQYLSLSPKKICEVCWLELLMLLWDALPSCMLSHFLPAGNPNRGGFPWSLAPHSCATQLLSSQALSCSARNVVAECWAQQELWERAIAVGRPWTGECCNPTVLWAQEMLWVSGCHLALLHRRAAQRCPADVTGMPT